MKSIISKNVFHLVLVLAALLLSLGITTGTVQAEGLVAYWPFDTDFSNAEGTADFDGIPAGTAEISAEDVKPQTSMEYLPVRLKSPQKT
ncbi:MAG: hypothetical protein ACYSUD_21550 [Planctomycetota bacterium]|jgi:hypothetical protein